MITKINIGVSLLASAYFYFANPAAFSNFDLKNDYLTIKEQQTPLQKSIARGKEIYNEFCMQCHQPHGKGDGMNFPPLDGSDWLKKKRTESIHSIKYGQQGQILVNGKKFNNMMPPLGLTNEEVADVMNYIMNSWSNKNKKMVTVGEVTAVKK